MPLTTIYGGGTRVIGDNTIVPQVMHPMVQSYIARLVENGYSPSSVRINALNNLIQALSSNGILEKCQAIYPFLGGTTANTHKWNLINNADTDAAFRLSFAGTWTFAETGIKAGAPANTNNYARTFYTPSSNATNNDSHLSVYIRDVFTGSGAPIGGRQGNQATSNSFQIFASTALSFTTMQAANTNNGVNLGTAGAVGFYAANRSSSTLQQAIYNGLVKASGVATSLSLATATGEILVGCASNGAFTSRQWPTTSEIGFASIGQSLTQVQHSAYYRLVQKYQLELGRQV